MSRYDIVCIHTIVGYAPAHAAHFSVHGDGTIDQSRDTKFRSAANLNGNYRVIAIENEDHGAPFPVWAGSNVPALTDAQVSANAAILRWANETHGVPLQLCPDSRSSSRGLAYHRQGIDGNFTDGYPGRVPGGELWTEHFGKVCPGANRIAQRSQILARALGSTPTPPPILEDDVYYIVKGDDGGPAIYALYGNSKVHFTDQNHVDRFVWSVETLAYAAGVPKQVIHGGKNPDGITGVKALVFPADYLRGVPKVGETS